MHTKKLTHEYTHAHAYTHTLSLPFSRLGTIAVSKCQRRSIWKAAVITVKAGHQWGARLTLLTCLHQHTWTASLAKQQFSHGASQNKVHCSHTLQWRKSSPTLHTHNAYLLYPHTKHRNNTLFSWNQKIPRIQEKALISYWFHLLSPLPVWREGDKK